MNVMNCAADLLAPLRAGPHQTIRDVETSYVYPSSDSVRGRILAALLRGKRITQADALRRWSTSRLSSAVFQLRGLGWPVMTALIPVLTSDNGREAVVARYSLPAHVIQKAGRRGREFAAAALKAERRVDR
jgi:hypothetical protein